MSSLKISEYLFFLKACHYGHRLLEKSYRIMHKLHRELLLDMSPQGSPCQALKDLGSLLDHRVSSMSSCYLPFLEEELIKQEAQSQKALIPIWDYALVLNDQQNIHRLLGKGDLKISRLLKKIEHHYRNHAGGRSFFWVEKLKKSQAIAQFMNEKILQALKETQRFLDKMPLSDERTSSVGAFERLMAHLKGYQAFRGPQGDDAVSLLPGEGSE